MATTFGSTPGANATRGTGWTFREIMALAVVVLGVVGVVTLCVIAIGSAKDGQESPGKVAMQLLQTILPVISVWVGTVLGFYFTKASYEAGSSAAIQTAQAAVAGYSSTAVVTTAMTPYPEMKRLEVKPGRDPDSVKLAEIFPEGLSSESFLAPGNSDQRVALLWEGTKRVVCVLHRSTITLYFAGVGIPESEEDRGAVTLGMIRGASKLFADRLDSWVTVAPTARLAEAKAVMDGRRGCRDVFVTDTGRSDGAVQGWLTNVRISQG